MRNDSGVYPVRDLVLIKPDEKVESKEGLIIVPETAKEREVMAQIFGTIIAIGESAYKYEEVHYNANTREKLTPGTRVMFAKYSGIQITGEDGAIYRVIRDDDVTAIVSATVKKEVEL